MLLITWDACGKKYSVGKSTQDVNVQIVTKRPDIEIFLQSLIPICKFKWNFSMKHDL